MADSPTIVVARLDDKELQESIKSMVTSFNKGLDDMKTHADSVVKSINESLKGIKGGSASSGGVSDDGSTKRAKAYSEEGKQIEQNVERQKEYNATLDQTAAAIQKATSGKKKGIEYMSIPSDVDKELTYLINVNDKLGRQLGDAMQKEQAILDAKNKEILASQEAARAQQQVTNAVSGTAIAYGDVHKMAEQALGIKHNADGSKKKEATDAQYLREQLASLLDVEQREVTLTNTKQASYDELSAELKQLTAAYHRLGADIAKTEGADIAQRIQTIQREMQKFQQTMSRPVSWDAVKNLPTKTLDDIAYKMRQMQLYKSGLDLKEQSREIAEVNRAYDSLRRAQLKYMSDAQKLTGINAALGRSWNYMKNRLAFYFTVGASTAFVKNLIEVRSQYEMNERALGILVNSAARGTRIFNELSHMSLVSPYTLIELSSAAKQLTAYDVAAKDVVETTRRLADMASAVGVPIERLTYALGQIKSYGYLNSRDARMFSNAGIPLVKQLAEYYSELEGKLVSVGDVYDRIKKKSIGYNEVMTVMYKMTDEGGKFFDFQAKMAETLKVRLANLTLAWNNMLNDIGRDWQGFMSGGLGLLTQTFKRWRDINRILGTVIASIGAYKTATFIAGMTTGASIGGSAVANWLSLAGSVKKAGDAVALFSLTVESIPFAGWVAALVSVVSYFWLFNSAGHETKAVLEEIRNAFDGVRGEMDNMYATAIKSDSIGTQLTKLKEMLELAQTELGVTIPVNLEEVNESNIDEKLKEAKKAIDDYINFSQTFSEAAAGSKVNDKMNEFGTNARSVYTSITESVNTLIVALEGLKDAGTASNREIEILTELEKGQRNDESRIEYLKRLISLYEELGIIGKKHLSPNIGIGSWFKPYKDNMSELAKEQEENLDRLNIKNRTVYATMLNDVQKYYSSISIADFQFRRQLERVAQKIDINNIPLAQRTIKLSAAINEEASLNNWNQFEKELAIMIANEVFGTQIEISEESKYAAQEDLKDWQKRMQTWAQNNGISVPITFQPNDTEKSYAERMLQAAKDAQGEYETLLRKQKQGTATQDAVDKAKQDYETARQIAKAAGADLSSLDKKRNKERNQAESELQKALKEELSLIEKVRSIYKDLTKEGASHANAVKRATSGWNETVNAINKVLAKNGLQKLDLTKFAGISNPRELVDMLQSQLDALVRRGAKPAEIKELQTKIQTLNVDVDKYDLTKITKGLNSELDKLKEEYELAVALDADPELGNVFASYFGIDTKKLPHNFEQVTKLAQERIGKVLQENHYEGTAIDVESLLDKKKFDQWVKDSGQELSSNLVKELEAIRDFLHKTQVDEIKSQEESWNKLLEKYAEYEYKKSQIMKTADEERKTLVDKFGTTEQKETYAKIKTQLDAEEDPKKKDALRTQLIEIIDSITSGNDTALQIKTAIDTKELRDLADLDFTEFQKSSTWIHATGDLATMSHKAIGILIDRITEYKKKAKDLSPKEVDKLSNALKKLHRANRSSEMFGGLIDALAQAKERVEDVKNEITEYQTELDALNEKKKKGEKLSDAELAKMDDLEEKIKRLKEYQKKAGSISASIIAKIAMSAQQLMQTGIGSLASMFDALGDEKTANALKKVDTVLNSMAQWASMIGSASGSGWGALAGAIAGLGIGLVTVLGDILSGNADITEQVEDSEKKVSDLELAYKRLEREVDKAYGTARIGAVKLAAANKELQLEELKRQLRLEESRKSKNRDEDKIAELKGKIIDLEYEIADATEDIVNNLLGISSVGDAMETLMDSFVEALRNGEDAMEVFNDSIDDMVANMVKKMLTTQILQPMFEKVWKQIEADIAKRGQQTATSMAALQYRINFVKGVNSESWDSLIQGLQLTGLTNEQISDMAGEIARNNDWDNDVVMQVLGSILQQRLALMERQYEALQRVYADDTEVTVDDIMSFAEGVEALKPEMEGYVDQIQALIDQFSLMKDDALEDKLSALQQGLSSMSEDTAGALEAMLNGISQQTYLHSEYLRQIAERMQAFDPEVSLGVQSQMLLQLQTQYQLMQSMHSLMSNWTTAAGNGIRVEML